MTEMIVEYDEHMGSDLTVVNRARVSFRNKSEWETVTVKEDKCDNFPCDYDCHRSGVCHYEYQTKMVKQLSSRDKGLIAYLARGCPTAEWDEMVRTLQETNDPAVIGRILYKVKNMATHWAPFSHPKVAFYMKIPIAIARQIYKHQIGFEYSEASRRYVSDTPEFYTPDFWRKADDNVKQGSSNEPIEDNVLISVLYEGMNEIIVDDYKNMITEDKLCPEQARFWLPQSMMTEFFVTGSLYGWARLYNQRSDAHAQRESQYIAEKIDKIVSPLFPVSWQELTRTE